MLYDEARPWSWSNRVLAFMPVFGKLAALRGLGTSMQSALIVTCAAVFLLSPYAKTCERLSTHLKEEQMLARITY